MYEYQLPCKRLTGSTQVSGLGIRAPDRSILGTVVELDGKEVRPILALDSERNSSFEERALKSGEITAE
jgi:hypothetical protein